MSNPFFNDNEKNIYSGVRQIGELGMIPFYLAAGPLVGFWMGEWLDRHFGTMPYLEIIFVALGVIAGIRESWRVIRRISKT